MKHIHVSIDIAGCIRNQNYKGFQDQYGHAMSERQAKDHLRYQNAMGKRFLPVGECPDFDYQKGCPGHEVPDIILPETFPVMALSIRQPWAWLIVRPDLAPGSKERQTAQDLRLIKDMENRTWFTPFRGKFLVHASKAWGEEEQDDREEIMDRFKIAIPEQPDLGGIVGISEVTGCITSSDSPWFCGPKAFTLANSAALPFVRCRGDRNFFKHGLNLKEIYAQAAAA